MTGLEKGGIGAGLVFGLIGTVVGGLSYQNSQVALRLSQVAAQAQVVITRASLIAPPTAGEYAAINVELQNFGQSVASDVRVSFYHSRSPQLPGSGAGLQGILPFGYTRVIRIGDQGRWPESEEPGETVAFFLTLTYVDVSSGQRRESTTAYFARGLGQLPPNDPVDLEAMVTP